MNSGKPLPWTGIAMGVGVVLILYFFYQHLQYFGNVSLLGGVLMLEGRKD